MQLALVSTVGKHLTICLMTKQMQNMLDDEADERSVKVS